MLRGMLAVANKGYRIRVTAIAGADHSATSRHYRGTAFDVDQINGVGVGSGAAHQAVLSACREAGATENLGPGYPVHDTHVHCGW
ncbi:hypothetical protein CGZ93_17170 [Enemella dayhoffiae]|uniref:Peptidase M15A C-terminal domain-containing protein n=1 Tax=Enemella dayhoffiae TaxID=2016507 RepID=A0A255GNY7_9ACTN|nr:hypothetical protein [Enemella dayhoffiae]OYO17291.1 hypothetical protein CGZ93_17170 [Enemella dayhoffiae]